MSMASEFKEFAMKGNVVDLAVGVIIGAAFGKIVSSLVGDIIMPPLGELIGGGLVPWLAGRAADFYGNLAVTMWIASGLAVIATVLTLFLVETAPVKVAATRKAALAAAAGRTVAA